MLVKILVLIVALILGVLASIRVWRIRDSRQTVNPLSSVGMVPGPSDPPDVGAP